MEWKKPTPEALEAFAAVQPPPDVAEPRKMFGMPCSFKNGNMYMGVFQDTIVLRLPEEERARLVGLGGAPFVPMPGRPMREYVTVPPKFLEDRRQLSEWATRSLRYAESLPAKAAKPARATKPASPAKAAAEAARPTRRTAATPTRRR